MRVETLCTGDELLSGVVVDTNSAYFAARVFERGAMVEHAEVVGDRVDAIAEALALLYRRADFAVVSGGLGPTSDDLTAEAAARAAGVPLVLDEPTLARIKDRFARRGLAWTPNNERQARVPRGAEVVANPHGTAPMFVVLSGRATVCFLPGPPREFTRLCDEEVMPRLEQLLAAPGARRPRAVRVLRCFGAPESHVDWLMRDIPERHPGVHMAFRTTLPENHLKLWAEGATDDEARASLAAAEAEARERLGRHCFGADGDTFAAVVGRTLKDHGATVALAESCTAGMAAQILSEVAGASDYLVASAVVYAEAAKTRLLGVPPQMLAAGGAVSEAVTLELARAARRLGATLGLAVTGYAGPTAGPLPVGTVFTALAGPDGDVARRHVFVGDREQIQRMAAYAVLDEVRTYFGGGA